MSLKKLKEFIKLAKEEGVASLKYESDKEKFSVDFSMAQTVATPHYSLPTSQDKVSDTSSITTDQSFHTITSPFVGTFYAQSSPEDPAYVKVGDKISKGSVLCILEAMKIMNEIEADVSGEIVEVCVENESLVEFGQTLFKVRV